MKEILENNFQTAYNEYKLYANYLDSVKEEFTKRKEDFGQFIKDNFQDKDKMLDELFELNTAPIAYAQDITKLENRLRAIYDTVKDIVELPEDIVKEMEGLPVLKFFFTIEGGEKKVLDKEMVDMAYENYKQQLEQNNT